MFFNTAFENDTDDVRFGLALDGISSALHFEERDAALPLSELMMSLCRSAPVPARSMFGRVRYGK